uniref:Uncharacterized protein n=1 Tax=Arundo donax TaxID=35708 RepID=A0A0A8ZJH3_ARUDO
MHLVFIKIQC